MTSKVVVVTGASSGIGEATAYRLAQQGHAVVLASRRAAELQRVAASCGNALAVPTDVTRRADVEALRDAALARHGRVDAWINNAGQGISRPVLQLTEEDVDAMMAVNLKSALYGIQAILPHFQQRGAGHLVNVSSFLGRVPLASFRSAYSAAKAALNVLTANLRMDLAASDPGIHVSLVMPGPVATAFPDNARGGTPAGRGGSMKLQTADEVAAVLVSILQDPRPEAYTEPGLAEVARAYRQDPAAFEANLRRRAPG